MIARTTPIVLLRSGTPLTLGVFFMPRFGHKTEPIDPRSRRFRAWQVRVYAGNRKPDKAVIEKQAGPRRFKPPPIGLSSVSTSVIRLYQTVPDIGGRTPGTEF